VIVASTSTKLRMIHRYISFIRSLWEGSPICGSTEGRRRRMRIRDKGEIRAGRRRNREKRKRKRKRKR